MKRLLTLTVIGSLLWVGCSNPSGNTVTMTAARRYSPDTITIQAGQKVKWVNESNEAHSVTAYQSSLPPGADYFSSAGYSSEKEARDNIGDLMTNGDTFSFKFTEPGTYEYFCIPHEAQGMKGKIVVEE